MQSVALGSIPETAVIWHLLDVDDARIWGVATLEVEATGAGLVGVRPVQYVHALPEYADATNRWGSGRLAQLLTAALVRGRGIDSLPSFRPQGPAA